MKRRLLEKTVIEIRRQFWNKGLSVKELSILFKLDHSHVSLILSRKLWNNTDDDYPAYKEQLIKYPEPPKIILPEEYIEIIIKKIELLDGSYASVSEIDYEYLLDFTWNIIETFPMIFDSKDYKIRMHDLVAIRMGIKGLSEIIDHKDRNQRNNTRSNLRPATLGQSNFNRSYKKNKDGYRGVIKNGDKYSARLNYEGTKIYGGVFDTPEEAHEEYIYLCKKYYGPYFDPDIH